MREKLRKAFLKKPEKKENSREHLKSTVEKLVLRVEVLE